MARVAQSDAERRAARAASARRWYEANRERVKAQRRARFAARSTDDRERDNARQREYYAANREKFREYARSYRVGGNEAAAQLRYRHGSDVAEAFAAMWSEQDGCCYLCGRPLIREKTDIDHDHTCCPDRKSCAYCRRGLTCPRCNKLIAFADDDPALLRRIADNFEPVLKATRARIAANSAEIGTLF